jgi:hypothetical protein
MTPPVFLYFVGDFGLFSIFLPNVDADEYGQTDKIRYLLWGNQHDGSDTENCPDNGPERPGNIAHDGTGKSGYPDESDKDAPYDVGP